MCEDENTTTYLRNVHGAQWMWLQVCALCGATQSWMMSFVSVSWGSTQAYMSSLAFALCFVTHSYIILVFPLRVPILILLSCCDNSSQLSPVVILHTFCTEEICHLRCGIYTGRMSVSWRRAIHPCAWCPALNITEFLVVADTMLGFCRADAL